MKSTFQELELTNGKVVKLTLNFARLLKIKTENIQTYEDFMRIIQGKDFDPLLDALKVIYVGYLCANIDNDEILEENEFYELVPFDIEEINIKAGLLIQSKKK